MDDEELQAYLDRPMTAVNSTVGAKGAPHSVPVWYRFADGRFTIWTGTARRWVRNIENNSRVSIVVAEHVEPFAAVVVRGVAEIAVDTPVVDEEIRRIALRYMPPEDVDRYIEQWASIRAIVSITPTQIRSWGRGF